MPTWTEQLILCRNCLCLLKVLCQYGLAGWVPAVEFSGPSAGAVALILPAGQNCVCQVPAVLELGVKQV